MFVKHICDLHWALKGTKVFLSEFYINEVSTFARLGKTSIYQAIYRPDKTSIYLGK